MISQKKLTEAILDTYRELYKYAVPSADFDSLRENCTLYVDGNGEHIQTEKPLSADELIMKGYQKDLQFDRYFVPKSVYEKIVGTISKKYRITKSGSDRFTYNFSVYLGTGPTTGAKNWLKNNKEYTIDDLQKMVDNTDYKEYTPDGHINIHDDIY